MAMLNPPFTDWWNDTEMTYLGNYRETPVYGHSENPDDLEQLFGAVLRIRLLHFALYQAIRQVLSEEPGIKALERAILRAEMTGQVPLGGIYQGWYHDNEHFHAHVVLVGCIDNRQRIVVVVQRRR